MDAKSLLLNAGLRCTAARMAVLHFFIDPKPGGQPVLPETIYRQLSSSRSPLILPTVYRVLSDCEKRGIVERYVMAKGRSMFAMAGRQRKIGHRVCRRCQSTEEIDDPFLRERLQAMADEQSFDIKDISLTVQVLCSDCSQASRHRLQPVRQRSISRP